MLQGKQQHGNPKISQTVNHLLWKTMSSRHITWYKKHSPYAPDKKIFWSCYVLRYVSRFFSDRLRKLVVYFGLHVSSLYLYKREDQINTVHKLVFNMQIFSLTCLNGNSFWNVAVSNVDYVFAYFCGGHKNNPRL